MSKTISIRVSGKVQGVFYRKSARTTARELGLTGWARNEADGSVSIMASGAETDLQEFINWCKQGPERANVDEVVVTEVPVQSFTSFETR